MSNAASMAVSSRRRLWLGLPLLWPLGLAALAQPTDKVVRITAKKFEYEPKVVPLKLGEPVILEFVSLDVIHGFTASELGLDAAIVPDKPVRLRFTPSRAGKFGFHCDHFCGDGHEEMEGEFVVSA